MKCSFIVFVFTFFWHWDFTALLMSHNVFCISFLFFLQNMKDSSDLVWYKTLQNLTTQEFAETDG